LKFILCV